MSRTSRLLALGVLAAYGGSCGSPTDDGRSADVETTVAGPATAAAGEEVTFLITVQNRGPDDASQVTLVDSLSPGLVPLDPGDGSSIEGATVRWPAIASLDPGVSRTFRVRALVDQPGELASVAWSTAATFDPSPANNDGSGSGSHILTARSANQAPQFGFAVTTADHNRPYEYQVRVDDPDGDPVETAVDLMPAWMEFDPGTLVLSGLAGWENLGNFPVRLRAFDGSDTTFQSFQVRVSVGEIICDQDFGDPAASQYILPFNVGETYLVNQSYCPPNPTWGHYNWFAYDFEMPIGTEVLASRPGTVIATKEDKPDGNRDCGPGSGNFVMVQHDDGTIIHYFHLTTNGALVDEGDVVQQGQLIGLSGDSGCSSGPHLHVSIFRERVFERQYTLPFNYRNARGPLDGNRGLVHNASYTAEAF